MLSFHLGFEKCSLTYIVGAKDTVVAASRREAKGITIAKNFQNEEAQQQVCCGDDR